LEINREFYQNFAAAFVDKRKRLQPGVLGAIEDLPMDAQVLELGCGHASLAAHLQRLGFQGAYVGLEQSEALLERRSKALRPPTFEFRRADFSEPNWPESLAKTELSDAELPERLDHAGRFDWVLAFAVIHHLPAEELRLAILTEIRRLLSPTGSFALSVWDFMNSSRLRGRIVPWPQAGLSADEVDPADFLLDWRNGGKGLRYVHHFENEELHGLAEKAGFQVLEQFHSDGGLGLYQRWRPDPGLRIDKGSR
jgi:SAM-dependent methyltransferase